MPFRDFAHAVRCIPSFITGLDLVGQHKTVADLAFLVQHEIDLAVEGEPNTITCCARQSDATKRWQKVRIFLTRCRLTMEQAG